MDVEKAKRIIKAITKRYQDGERTTGGGFEIFCINHRITCDEYFKIEEGVAEEEIIRLSRQSRWIMDEKLTPLEYRLYLGIPTYIHYGYKLIKKQMYPCMCLKRKPYSYRINNRLTGALEGWYSRGNCHICKGEGYHYRSRSEALHSRPARRLVAIERKIKLSRSA
ncbi:hypothetical protein LCGC14_2504760 [marine sediment metagenome]|uniref:Uncharacterized protein n=1 Tax=marine sediment metagenome TaxID=412755 RepID=A0A0F9DUF9_9ZZZZ